MITAENKVFIGLSVIIKNVYLVGESNFRLSNFWLVKGDSPPPSPQQRKLSVTILICMEDQQKYQINFTVPESLDLKLFFISSHQLKRLLMRKYQQIPELLQTSTKILTHIFHCVTPLLDNTQQNMVIFQYISTGNKYIFIKQYMQFYMSTRIFLL